MLNLNHVLLKKFIHINETQYLQPSSIANSPIWTTSHFYHKKCKILRFYNFFKNLNPSIRVLPTGVDEGGVPITKNLLIFPHQEKSPLVDSPPNPYIIDENLCLPPCSIDNSPIWTTLHFYKKILVPPFQGFLKNLYPPIRVLPTGGGWRGSTPLNNKKFAISPHQEK